MSLTVVGSIAFDAVRTPFGERERMLGGSAVHFSLAASFFTDVRVVGPVGDDFGADEYAPLHARGVATDDIERVAGGRTNFWRGHYGYDLNTAHTDDTQLNVFGDFLPKLSAASQSADVLFLANIQPDLQRQVRLQCAVAVQAGDRKQVEKSGRHLQEGAERHPGPENCVRGIGQYAGENQQQHRAQHIRHRPGQAHQSLLPLGHPRSAHIHSATG